jgi:hypothetical protein
METWTYKGGDDMKNKNTNITFDEVMKELDKYRVGNVKQIILTDQQKEFITKCRMGNKKVPYNVMVSLWEKMGWGKIGDTSMRRRIYIVKELNKKGAL